MPLVPRPFPLPLLVVQRPRDYSAAGHSAETTPAPQRPSSSGPPNSAQHMPQSFPELHEPASLATQGGYLIRESVAALPARYRHGSAGDDLWTIQPPQRSERSVQPRWTSKPLV